LRGPAVIDLSAYEADTVAMAGFDEVERLGARPASNATELLAIVDAIVFTPHPMPLSLAAAIYRLIATVRESTRRRRRLGP